MEIRRDLLEHLDERRLLGREVEVSRLEVAHRKVRPQRGRDLSQFL